ncbi:hypothetical protein BHU72_07180 [Desulfuribacillus stibiiarsenatis]|uniref:C_GCAxxG_C_C family protein n=1 Tax=Desulfuribacillus stibiiarsenatis TaxID=1390249 RepID=A0A1E5L4E1_9FIRM|nr:C-GCAxxG-C-C family (seleno)protein [Desulfuribacillus stibiiarsenatis]OEH84966.1 hypothetical protein BHU72_07180 [Desulfuribacillus stibiiarsenatis]
METVTTAEVAKDKAMEAFKQKSNCCESMIRTSIELLELPIPPEVVNMGRFFQKGVAGSGCVCGALAGGMMILGYVLHDHPRGLEAAKKFEQGFREQNSSTCCRVIHKKQGMLNKITGSGCCSLTGNSAELLFSIIEEYKGE